MKQRSEKDALRGPHSGGTGGEAAGAVPRPPAQDVPKLVKVKQVSGSGGGGDGMCSWGYDVWPLHGNMTIDDERIIEDAQPLHGRSDFGEYDAAAEGSLGLAYDSNDWKLIVVFDEVLHFGECDCTW